MTTFDLDEYIFGALEAGASGFVLKDIEPDDLVDAVCRVARGEGTLAQTITRQVIIEFAPAPAGFTGGASPANEDEGAPQAQIIALDGGGRVIVIPRSEPVPGA